MRRSSLARFSMSHSGTAARLGLLLQATFHVLTAVLPERSPTCCPEQVVAHDVGHFFLKHNYPTCRMGKKGAFEREDKGR